MSINCCLNCGERTLGCHSTCKKYIKAKEEYDNMQEASRKYRADNQAAIERVVRIRRYQRNK